MKLLNAFSLSMIQEEVSIVKTEELSLFEVKEILWHEGIESCVGHESTAALFSSLIGKPVKANRVSVSLEPGEIVIVGQYSGPRLEEGAVHLPEGATLRWIAVTLFKEGDLEKEYTARKKRNLPV
jgi:hypothetical protein